MRWGFQGVHLGKFPKHYMSKDGLSPEESAELVAVNIALERKLFGDAQILQTSPTFPGARLLSHLILSGNGRSI